jgi:hypothetical protein
LGRDSYADQTSSGGINNFEFVVTDAWFGKSQAFTDKTGLDTIFMHWVGTTNLEDERFQRLDAEGFHPSWNLGADWEPIEDGKKVRYDGSSKKPRVGKWYGRLAEKVLNITEDIANTPEDPLGGDAMITDASVWLGTKWFLEEVEYDFGNMGLSSHLMPTQYLGRVAVGASPGSPAPAPASAPVAEASASNGLRDQIIALAKASPTYQEFQSAALSTPGVVGDVALVQEIADQTRLYDLVRGT